MPAPPLLRILHLRQNEKRFERLQHPVVSQSDRRTGANDQRVKIPNSRFLLRRNPARVARPRIGHELGFETELLSYDDLHFFAQLGRRRNGNDDLTFLFRRVDNLVPFRRAKKEGKIVIAIDRKSTRLNSSHGYISYAVFCLKKKNDFHGKL